MDVDDAFPLNSTYVSDIDGDTLPDSIDLDLDGDGVANIDDAFPNDFTEWRDTDGDGVGDKMDMDDDGDGVIDALDTKPLDPGQDPKSNDNVRTSLSSSSGQGTITIDIQDILILLAISSMLTLGFLWRAKNKGTIAKAEDEKEIEV